MKIGDVVNFETPSGQMKKGRIKAFNQVKGVYEIVSDGTTYSVWPRRIKESTQIISLDKFLELYKDLYIIGTYKKAAEKVAERVNGFTKVTVKNAFDGLAGEHCYATNGKTVVDLTFPGYAKGMIRQRYKNSWVESNKNKVVFEKTEYERNIK